VKVDRTELLKSLEAVSPGLSTDNILEQSGCFVFHDGCIHTYNDEISCSVASPVAELEGAVRATEFIQLLKKLGSDSLDMQMGEGRIEVRAGKNKWASFSVEQEVRLPLTELEVPEKWKKLAPDFVEALCLVSRCAGSNDSELLLTCAHITKECIEATDGFQAIRWPVKSCLQDVLLRKNAIGHLRGLNPTTVGETESWIHFRNDVLKLSCRKYAMHYPDISPFFECDGQSLKLPKGIGDAVSRAKICKTGQQDADWVEVRLKPGSMMIIGQGVYSTYREKFDDVGYEGTPLNFRISPEILASLASRSEECVASASRMKVTTPSYTYVSCLSVVSGI